MTAARNILIVLALAAVVEFAPGGGDTAALVNAVLLTLLNVIFVYFGVRFYRERRLDIYALGDRGRALLYGGVAGIVLALAGTRRWLDTGAGTIVWVLVIGGALVALVSVFRQYREYGG
jgi:multisubunit Na+/H+ antiporter MnhB subunit